MAGKIRSQVRLHGNWANTWTTTAVRNAKGFVQVKVRHIAAKFTGLTQTHHGVEVSSIDVNLTAVRVNQIANLTHVLFEHTVSRGIGNHNRREIIAVLFCLRAKIIHVDFAISVTRSNHNFHTAHLRRSGIGAVGRTRNQTNIAMRIAACGVIAANGQQARILAL